MPVPSHPGPQTVAVAVTAVPLPHCALALLMMDYKQARNM
jgi:hypothetical protein